MQKSRAALFAIPVAILVGVAGFAFGRTAPEAEYDYQYEYLPPISTNIPPADVVIDVDAVIELKELLTQFVPLAETHGIEFDVDLQTELQSQSIRHGIFSPVAISVPGVIAPAGAAIETVYLTDDAALLAGELAGAAEAWIATLATAPTVTRTAQLNASTGMADTYPNAVEMWQQRGRLEVASRSAYAPASRGGVRSGQPVTALAVRELSVEFDNWITNEATAAQEAAANRAAELRARMVALSRAHGNGRLPAEALCPIPFSPRFTMRCDVIDSLVELNTAFRAHFGRDLVVRSGYRGNPGTSNHGWGLAVDFGGQMTEFHTSEFNWMIANARNFGWGHAFWAVPGGINPQPWHWEAMSEIRELTGRWS